MNLQAYAVADFFEKQFHCRRCLNNFFFATRKWIHTQRTVFLQRKYALLTFINFRYMQADVFSAPLVFVALLKSFIYRNIFSPHFFCSLFPHSILQTTSPTCFLVLLSFSSEILSLFGFHSIFVVLFVQPLSMVSKNMKKVFCYSISLTLLRFMDSTFSETLI